MDKGNALGDAEKQGSNLSGIDHPPAFKWQLYQQCHCLPGSDVQSSAQRCQATAAVPLKPQLGLAVLESLVGPRAQLGSSKALTQAHKPRLCTVLQPPLKI